VPSSSEPSVLVVDDDAVTCDLLAEVFSAEGFRVHTAQNPPTALKLAAASPPDVVVTDLRMGSRDDGLQLLERMRQEHPSVPVVLITAFGSIETAIRAVKDGAFDYVSKPFELAALVGVVRRALARRMDTTPRRAEEAEEELSGLRPIMGRSPGMLEVYKLIAKVADADAAVLVTGDSGTGKELVARAIHKHGVRRDLPFVAVNCGAVTETLLESELFGHTRGAFTGAVAARRGLFEQAGAGTVFLDEVGEMSPGLQVKLLRVLQEREFVPVGGSDPVQVRARIIAASNVDLHLLAESGSFRRDLLYRLDVINICLPPLRARREDIPLLARQFLRRFTPPGRAVPACSDAFMSALCAYSWPGNVRELENTIERAVTLSAGHLISESDLPAAVLASETAATPDPATFFEGMPTLDEMERRYVEHVLQTVGGNRTRAAEVLGVNRRTLSRMAARVKPGI
jgi:two-component system response regulator AtoC